MNLKLSIVFFLLLISFYVTAQENSPFSRYGLGDTYPSQNIINRAMGGVASTYANGQSINLSNPAAYSELKIVTYDLGLTLDTRSLKSAAPVLKYSSVNLTPSYVALGMPLSKKHNLGLAFGLKPISKVSYSIEQNVRLPADSMQYLYEGDGGLYQAFIGIGKRWGGLRLGINTGYMFGRKESNTIATSATDTVLSYRSNSQTLTTYNKLFINAGFQYDAKLSKTTTLRFGFAGNLKQKLNAEQQVNRETFNYDQNGAMVKVDSVYQRADKGNIELPVSYTAGISLNSSVIDHLGNRFDKSLIAVEYESTKWTDYRFYGRPDKLINSWQVKAGGQFTPNPLSIKSYWNRVTYRAGFYYGKDAVNADGNELPIFGFTIGTGLPIRKWRSFDNQYTIINTAIEIGKRGNKNNNITEGFFRISLGLNLSDIWFVKRKYD